MSEQKQFNSRIDRDLADRVGGLDMSNREAMEKAFEMFLRARGMADEESIEDEIRDIDREMQRVRREANERLNELATERDELVETLEWRREQDDLVEMTIEEIAEGLASNPNQNLHAYTEQVEFLVAHSNGPHDRQTVQARVNEYATQNDLYVSPKQLYPDRWDASTPTGASADGRGGGGEEPADGYDGFNYGEDE